MRSRLLEGGDLRLLCLLQPGELGVLCLQLAIQLRDPLQVRLDGLDPASASAAEIAVVDEHPPGPGRVALIQQELERFLPPGEVGGPQLPGELAAVRGKVSLTLPLLGLELRSPGRGGLSLLTQPIERVPCLADRLFRGAQLSGEAVPLRLTAAHLARDARDLVAQGLELRPGLSGIGMGMLMDGMSAAGVRRRSEQQTEEERPDQAEDAEASHIGAIMRALFTAGAIFSVPSFMDRLVQYFQVNHWLVAATVVVLVVVMVYEYRARAESFAALAPQDVIRLMNRGAVVIDLRPAEQYAAGHLAGARRMDGEQILKASDTLKKYKQKALIVYDEAGSLGGSAARQLKAQGFEQAFNMRGGLAAWRADNLPLEKGSKASG